MRISGVLDRPRRFIRRFFVDPLTVKELSGIARRWQMYLGRCIYIGLIGFIIWMFWSTLSDRGALSPSAYAELGHRIFFSFFALQMVIVTLGGITAASDMITREIRNGTLGLLSLTPLTPWRIVAGKWKAALVQTSTALLCGIPVFSVCNYLGGVGFWELAYSFTLSVVSAALGAAIALLCSTLFRASYVATIASFIALLAYCLLPIIAISATDASEVCMGVLSCIHPLYAAIGATWQGTIGRRYSWSANGWMATTIVTSLLIYLLLRWAASRVRMLSRRPGGAALEAPSIDGVGRLPVAPAPRTSSLARFFRGQGGVWERNAILWKELSTRRVGAGKSSRLGMALLAFALLTTLGSEGWWRVLVLWVSSLILLLVALANGVSLFVTEREERKWDSLLSTPLGAGEIVWAKLLAGLAGMAPFALMLAVLWGFLALVYDAGLVCTGMALVSMGMATLLCFLVAASTSLAAQSQRTAFSSAFGLLLGLYLVVPVALLMLQGYEVISRQSKFAESVIGYTNPGRYLAYVSEPLSHHYRGEGWSQYWRRQEEELVPLFGVYFGVYLGAILSLIFWLIRRFDRSAGRS
jgi:ABC-type transport system involved in multi-copper enzyme maturation permease subunit